MGLILSREQQMVKAASDGNAEIVKRMVNLGCFVNYNNCEALTAAAIGGHRDLILLLFDFGACPQSHGGWTSLIQAALHNKTEVVDFLMAHGATIDSVDDNGNCLLKEAAVANNIEAAKFALEKKANTETKDKDGWTALQWAVSREHTEMVELLTKAGADPRKGKRGPPGTNEEADKEAEGASKDDGVTATKAAKDPEEKKKGSCCCVGGSKKKKEEKGDDDTGFLEKGSAV